MITPDGRERRRWPRLEERKHTNIVVVSAPFAPMLEGRRYCCFTEDLSVGGVRFCLDSDIPLSSILRMDIEMDGPDGGVIQHMGRVAWEQEFENGANGARWLGVEIIETLGGVESLQHWQRVASGRNGVA